MGQTEPNGGLSDAAGRRAAGRLAARSCSEALAGDQSGATAIEYGLIVSLIFLASSSPGGRPDLQHQRSTTQCLEHRSPAPSAAPHLGRAGLRLAGLACGAQPVRVTISKVAATPPVGLGEPLGVDLAGAGQQRAGERPAGAVGQDVGLAHGAQVGHQLQRVVVAHRHPVDVGHRQGEAGALQQARGVAGCRRRARRAARRRRAARSRRRSAPGAARSASRRRAARRGTGRPASAPGGSGSARRPGRWSSAGRASRPPGRGCRRRTAAAPRPATSARPGAAGQHGGREVGLDQQADARRRAALAARAAREGAVARAEVDGDAGSRA